MAKSMAGGLPLKGLLMISAGTSSTITRPPMPLVITDERREKGISTIEEGLSELQRRAK
jgi:4-aminobutyrate aminotransferase-like enzyme